MTYSPNGPFPPNLRGKVFAPPDPDGDLSAFAKSRLALMKERHPGGRNWRVRYIPEATRPLIGIVWEEGE